MEKRRRRIACLKKEIKLHENLIRFFEMCFVQLCSRPSNIDKSFSLPAIKVLFRSNIDSNLNNLKLLKVLFFLRLNMEIMSVNKKWSIESHKWDNVNGASSFCLRTTTEKNSRSFKKANNSNRLYATNKRKKCSITVCIHNNFPSLELAKTKGWVKKYREHMKARTTCR